MKISLAFLSLLYNEYSPGFLNTLFSGDRDSFEPGMKHKDLQIFIMWNLAVGLQSRDKKI